MTNENPGNQIGVLEKLVAGVNTASPERAQAIGELMLIVAEAYPGQEVEQSWMIIGRMRDAVGSDNVAAYNAARDADPNGKLARIVGVIYAQHPVKNREYLERFMEYESSYIAQHPENLGIETK